MKETKLTSEQLAIIAGNNGLKMYLEGLSSGREATPRSAVYHIPEKGIEMETEAVKAAWLSKLESLKEGDTFAREVYQFDLHQLEKWGPQGKIAPMSELLQPVVYPTFEKPSDANTAAFASSDWRLAKDVVRKQLSGMAYAIRPVPYESVVDDMRARDTLESNSGWPLFTRRNKPEVIAKSIADARSGAWREYPAIALFRNYRQKTRLVWMYPMATNLVEGSYLQPLQRALMASAEDALSEAPYPNGVKRDLGIVYSDQMEHFICRAFFSPWVGFDPVRRQVSAAYAKNLFVAASDFSSTDAHFREAATMEVFDVIAPLYQSEYRDGLRDSLQAMHRIPLIVSLDSMIEGEHGVSSGSNWTNFVETIFDAIFSTYVTFRLGGDARSRYRGFYAIGDDMAWFSPKFDPHFAESLEALGKRCGQVIKAEKTTNDRDKVVSLQRLFQRGYLNSNGLVRAVYPSLRALNSILYPEKMHKQKLWSKDMAAIRTIMILENCVDHPLYEEFVRFIAAGDPYLIEFAHLHTKEQNKLFRQSKLVPGLNTTYNQERRDSSIADFKTVQVLKQL